MPDYTTPGADRHAVFTGPTTGVIPTPSRRVKVDELDVTPDVLYCDTQAEAVAVAKAIAAAGGGK